MTTPNPTASVSSPTPIPERPTLYTVVQAVSNLSILPVFSSLSDAQIQASKWMGAVVVTIPGSTPTASVPANPQQSGGDWRAVVVNICEDLRTIRQTLHGDRTTGKNPVVNGVCERYEVRINQVIQAAQEAVARIDNPQPPDIKPDLSGESRTGEWLPEGMLTAENRASQMDKQNNVRWDADKRSEKEPALTHYGLLRKGLDERDSQWRSECERLARERDELMPILMAVERKFPGETRAQTALKYVQQAEARANDPGQPAKQG